MEFITYPFNNGCGSFWANALTNSCSSATAPTARTSKSPEVYIHEGGDVIHGPAKKVPLFLNLLYSLLRILKIEHKCS